MCNEILTVVPSYYSKFSCINKECKHNCCIGWEIDVDDESYEYYMSIDGALGEKLRKNIVEEDTCRSFALGNNERCPFLDENNLCYLIISLGEDSLCDICKMHPRFRNFFSDRVEIGVGLCCEAAAELIVSYKDKVRLEKQGNREEDASDEEKLFFELRERIFDIMQNRQKNINERVDGLMKLCHINHIVRSGQEWERVYRAFERLDKDWDKKLDILKNSEFNGFPDDMGTEYEQLILYFIYRHMSEGLYEGNIRERICFALHAPEMICRISGSDSSAGDIAETARMYSAEIEYCSENTEKIIEEMNVAAKC